MNLSLIGLRGVGKSNIARRIALLTKRPVLSTDVLIEYETGRSIPQLVAERGWRAFRDAEFEVVRKVAALHGVVVDCGGGIVVDLADDGTEVYSERKVDALRAGGPVVFLKGDVERLAAKSTADPTRPVLDEHRSAVEIMRRRLPFYERAADLVVDVEGRRRAHLATEIVGWAQAEGWSGPARR